MVEPLPNSNQQQEHNVPLSSTNTKINELNVDADEFLPSIATQDVTGNEREKTEVGITVSGTGSSEEIATDKTSTLSESTIPKETQNIVVKRDTVRKKELVCVLFCGHVDAGKSTIESQLVFLTEKIGKSTLQEYDGASVKSWYSPLLATDVLASEAKTVDTERTLFETERKHIISQRKICYRYNGTDYLRRAKPADIAILVISARKGEFETGFERGGQTREHAMLVKTAGVRYLVVLINKMDDPTVNWDQARYDEIKDKLTPYLKKCGFKPGADTVFMPCSGMSGAILKDHPGEQILPWYKGPTFIEYLDSLPSFNRSIDGPLRMPIVERYEEMGVTVMGKIESGCCRVGDRCMIMPNRTRVEVTNIYYEEIETDSCVCGETVRLKLKNVEEEEISPGFILCDAEHEPCGVGKVFDAQVTIIEHKSIICCGYSTFLHMHTAAVKVQLKKLITLIDRKTGERTQEHPRFIKQDQVAIARFELSQSGQAICMERFKHFPQLGRFILCDEGRAVAVGKVLKIVE